VIRLPRIPMNMNSTQHMAASCSKSGEYSGNNSIFSTDILVGDEQLLIASHVIGDKKIRSSVLDRRTIIAAPPRPVRAKISIYVYDDM